MNIGLDAGTLLTGFLAISYRLASDCEKEMIL